MEELLKQILAEQKRTNERLDKQEKRFGKVEIRLENLEEQTKGMSYGLLVMS